MSSGRFNEFKENVTTKITNRADELKENLPSCSISLDSLPELYENGKLVIGADGHPYNADSLSDYLETSSTSPMTTLEMKAVKMVDGIRVIGPLLEYTFQLEEDNASFRQEYVSSQNELNLLKRKYDASIENFNLLTQKNINLKNEANFLERDTINLRKDRQWLLNENAKLKQKAQRMETELRALKQGHDYFNEENTGGLPAAQRRIAVEVDALEKDVTGSMLPEPEKSFNLTNFLLSACNTAVNEKNNASEKNTCFSFFHKNTLSESACENNEIEIKPTLSLIGRKSSAS